MIRSLRLALRRIRQTPWSSLAVVAVSSVGIAGVASVFSIVNTAWLRPLPNEWENRLVRVQGIDSARWVRWPIPVAVARDVRRGIGDEADVAAFEERSVLVRVGDRTERVNRTAIDDALFRVLRVQPTSGRMPTRAEFESDAPVVLAREDFWRGVLRENEFREGVVVEVDGGRREVIGLMPADFQFPGAASLWMPLPPNIASVSLVAEIRNHRSHDEIEALGDSALASGRTGRARARAWRISVQELRFRGKYSVSISLAGGFFVLSGLLLLAAVLTAGSLLQARSARRERGYATALALGASRFALVREAVVEHALLAASAAVLGVGLTAAAMRALKSTLARDLPGWLQFGLDWRVLLFVCGVVMVVILVHALSTASAISRVAPARALAEANSALTPTSRRSRRGAVTIRWQLVVMLPVVVAASLVASQHAAVAWGGDANGFRRGVDASVYLHDSTKRELSIRTQLVDLMAERLAQDPRIDLVSRYGQPLGVRGGREFVGTRLFGADVRDGRPLESEIPWMFGTDSAYLVIHAQSIVRGRHFSRSDSSASTLAIIVEASHATALWGSVDVIGRRVRIGAADGPLAEVVGVVSDRTEPMFSGNRLVLTGRRQFYLSRWQLIDGQPRLMVRARADGDDAVAALNAVGAAVDPSIEVFPSRLADVKRLALLPLRLVTSILVAVALLVNALAFAGLFALVRMRIADRRQELGIRLAVGAAPRALSSMLMKDVGKEIASAILLGTVLSLAVAALARSVTTMPTATVWTFLLVSLGASLAALVGAVVVSSKMFLTITPVELLRSRN